jgi:DNA-binding MarR family transcriptional regulator
MSARRYPPEPLEPLLSALVHPIRAQVLALLSERNASAAEIAEATGEPIGKVRYHLRSLAKSGLIGWQEAEDRRGVREYYWGPSSRQILEDEQHSVMSPEEIRLVSLYSLRLMFGDATTGLREGAFVRRNDHCLMRFRPQVDEAGWKELVKVYRSAIAGIERVSERASKRLARSGEIPIPVSASLLLFDLQMPARGIADVPPPQKESPQ